MGAGTHGAASWSGDRSAEARGLGDRRRRGGAADIQIARNLPAVGVALGQILLDGGFDHERSVTHRLAQVDHEISGTRLGSGALMAVITTDNAIRW